MVLAAMLLMCGTLTAQNYIVVESEKVFKSLSSYNEAIDALDKLAKEYQEKVDAKYDQVESLYNKYVEEKASLSASVRQQREQEILSAEKSAQEYQESIFGQEGELMKKRMERIKPIQEKVFAAIEAYAKSVGAGLVLDSSNNPSLLYTSAEVEHTQQVINALKK